MHTAFSILISFAQRLRVRKGRIDQEKFAEVRRSYAVAEIVCSYNTEY